MADFCFQFEWEDSPRVRTPELAATWARLEIRANQQQITKVEARRSQSIRTGIYVPLFPIAEWLVSNWFFLWEEWRAHARDEHHSLLAAREGFALPDLRFQPTESQVELRWCRSQAPLSGLEFLSEGSVVLPKGPVQDECTRLVEAVIERLDNRSVEAQRLASDWRAVVEATSDPELRTFCGTAARLGCDPFDLPEDTAAQIEGLGSVLPEPVLDDFCDAIHLEGLASGALTVMQFINQAASTIGESGQWARIREQVRPQPGTQPWIAGYAQARSLRNLLGDRGPIALGIKEYLQGKFGPFQLNSFGVASSDIDGITAPSATDAPVFGINPAVPEEKMRFLLCRALSDHLFAAMPSLVTRVKSEHQQRNRAFAAEFLVPAESLRRSIHGGVVGEEELSDLAQEYKVSEFVLRHQIQNHGLAAIAA